MHPELFNLGNVTIHTYGVMIMLGALSGYTYISFFAKKELGINPERIQSLAVYVILSAFIGGKLFFYFEKPDYYFGNPSNMLADFRNGFVFYGSLIFAVPICIWFFRKEKWPLWPMLDLLAITACIVHAFGRMGCYFAGCCYGVPTDKAWGITFTDTASQAPLHVDLHPTQLYSVGLILTILGVLLLFKRHKRFEGQLFFIYLILYAAGRSFIEIFRGDLRRGFVIEDVLSHSQFISILVIAITLWAYVRFQKRARFKKR